MLFVIDLYTWLQILACKQGEADAIIEVKRFEKELEDYKEKIKVRALFFFSRTRKHTRTRAPHHARRGPSMASTDPTADSRIR